jgi:hypothetical protein
MTPAGIPAERWQRRQPSRQDERRICHNHPSRILGRAWSQIIWRL